MSGAADKRTSSRTNKGVPPARLGFEQQSKSTGTRQQDKPDPPNSLYIRLTIPELEREISESKYLLQLCQAERVKAVAMLQEFDNVQEEGLEAEQLKRFKAAKVNHSNANEIERQTRNRIEELMAVLKWKNQQDDINPDQSAASAKKKRDHDAVTVSSIRSTSSKKRSIENSTKKKLLELQSAFEDQKFEYEEKLEDLQQQLTAEKEEEKKDEIVKKITYFTGKLDRATKMFEKRKALIKEQQKVNEEQVDIEEDNEQDLGSEDEDFHSISHMLPDPPRSELNPFLPLPHQQHSGEIPAAISPENGSNHHGLQSLPPMQNCTVYVSSEGGHYNEKRLPGFDGNPAKYATFISAYRRTEAKFSSGVNLTRLQEALHGKAADAVTHLTANPDNLPKIMEILERRFGKPEYILDYLVHQAKHSKPPELNKPQSIVDFGTLVESLVTNVQTYGESSYLNDRHLVMELVDKLPGALRDQWGSYLLEDMARKPTLQHFATWIDTIVRRAELFIKPDFGKESKPKDKKSSINAVAEEKPKKRPNCEFCDMSNHNITKCFKFAKLEADKKWDFVKEKKLCFLCLKGRHSKKNCKSEEKCQVKGCKYEHHTLLHTASKPSKKKEEGKKEELTEEEAELLHQLKNLGTGETNDSSNFVTSINVASSAALPIIPVVVKGPQGSKRVYALLDSGASCSVLEEDVAAELGLKGVPHRLNITVFGKERRNLKSSLVNMDISGSYRHAPEFSIKQVRTISKLGIPGYGVNAEELKGRYPHLRRMNVRSCTNAVPKMIIGFDNYKLYASRQILEDNSKPSPSAYRGLLGWYVCDNNQAVASMNFMMEEEENLNSMMKDYFSLEGFGVQLTANSERSKEDKEALQLMEKYTKQLDTGRWETCLLYRDEDCSLPESYRMATKRLSSMERKMDSNSEFAQLVQEKFTDYISKGFLRKVNKKDEDKKQWYLPWFVVYHPNKKPRLVFDAAAKSNGKCLNDFLYKGPDYLEPLPAVLMRFRRHLIGVVADIKEMFHQVQLKEEDRPSQTILYRGMDRTQPPEKYEMTVLFFGSASSPSSAIYVKTQNAAKYKEEYPEIVEAITRDCYMDDFPSGGDTPEEVINLQQVVTRIHNEGGFPMLKWNSSSSDVYDAIPEDIRAEKKIPLQLNNKTDVQVEKTLGLSWDPISDQFMFQFAPKPQHEDIFSGKKVPTKREVSSILMSLFDPLGFIAPVKVKGLIILQSIWRSGIGWDDEVSSNVYEDWMKWLQDLGAVKDVTIPRALSPVSLKLVKDIQLHVFVDASEEAYAAAAYLRIDTGSRIVTPFIIGKSRVAPLKQLSIPRMELQAAVMGVRLAKAVKAAYDKMKITKTVYWSDSRTVLCWIRSTSGRFNTFVANRIGEILDKGNSDPQDWKWVPTKENPADAATRSGQLTLDKWLLCTGMLQQPEANWPKERHQEKEETQEYVNSFLDEPLEEVAVSNVPSSVLPDINRFSSWIRLIRSTAMVLVAVRRFKKTSGSRGDKHITMAELEKAKLLWIRQSQQNSFGPELKEIQNGPLGKANRLLKLSPTLDRHGIIVMSSRIRKAAVVTTVKAPPILDPNDKYTKLMVKWFHHVGQHYGQERVINELRQHAWIINCRGAVRKCKSECFICKKKRAMPVPPEMGQLPFARLEDGHPPFYNCGIDLFGPIMIKNKRSLEKRWGVIFSCMATRAVHLDICKSLETSDFLNSLIRFINLRGKPAHVWSDNGTNFVGAEREIRENLEQWNQDLIRSALQIHAMEWHWNPPSSPHMGGSWERLIGDTKKILRQILKEQEPAEELLRTLFAEVTGILNSRPITRASPDPDDNLCLTPNHLLNVPCVVGASITGVYQDHHRYAKSWERSQLLARQFWERWSIEYLPWLAKRQKWHQKSVPLQVGDTVIVLEDNAPRNAWKMGIITATFPAKDGQVRKAEVKIAHVDHKDPKKTVKYSTLIRPAMKICRLSLDKETDVSGGRNVAE